MSLRVICDLCDRPITVEDNGQDVFVRDKHTLEVNTTKLFPHLCERCASKIDMAVLLAKQEWLKQVDISDRNSRINTLRRNALGTKG